MQHRSILLAVALLVVPVASLSALSEARVFLRSHTAAPPNGDQLAELNRENPEAYALVKALLTKRSLGLLNPRHPTASFAAPKQEAPEAEQGPEVFENMASPEERRNAHHQNAALVTQAVAMPYAEVAPAAHHDWLNWKATTADNDEQMVQNVLGAVAELKGGKKAGLLSKKRSSESALSADEDSLGVEAEPAAAPAKPAAPAQPAAPPAQENGYLKAIDFGIRAPEAKPAPSAPHENSYLKGLDLTGDMPKPAATHKKTSQLEGSSSNLLSSFSWDDSKPAEAEKPKVVQAPKPTAKENSLMSWLGVVDKAPAPKAAPVAPAKPSNPYLMDLSDN